MDTPDARADAERAKIQAQIAAADKESSNVSSDSDLMLADNKASGFYDKACEDYQGMEVERTNNLNNISKIIQRLLKKGNVPIGT